MDEVFPLLDQRMRDLYDAHICADPLVRHALRFTCRTLRLWIKCDKKFVKTLGFFAGRVHDTSELTCSLIKRLVNVSNLHSGWGPLVFYRDITREASSDRLIYRIDVSKFSERNLGEVQATDISTTLEGLFGGGEMWAVLTSLISNEYLALFYHHWRYEWDSNVKQVILCRMLLLE